MPYQGMGLLLQNNHCMILHIHPSVGQRFNSGRVAYQQIPSEFAMCHSACSVTYTTLLDVICKISFSYEHAWQWYCSEKDCNSFQHNPVEFCFHINIWIVVASFGVKKKPQENSTTCHLPFYFHGIFQVVIVAFSKQKFLQPLPTEKKRKTAGPAMWLVPRYMEAWHRGMGSLELVEGWGLPPVSFTNLQWTFLFCFFLLHFFVSEFRSEMDDSTKTQSFFRSDLKLQNRRFRIGGTRTLHMNAERRIQLKLIQQSWREISDIFNDFCRTSILTTKNTRLSFYESNYK